MDPRVLGARVFRVQGWTPRVGKIMAINLNNREQGDYSSYFWSSGSTYMSSSLNSFKGYISGLYGGLLYKGD